MRSAAVLILIAFIALALSGCGASVAEFTPAPVEGVLAAAAELLPGEDSAAFTFTAPAGCELRARVLRWDGEWLGCGEAAVFSAPDEGALVLSFDSVAGGFAASLTDAEGAVQARQRFATKGCGNKCGFCAVQTLEPKFIPYIDIKDRIKAIDERFGPKKDLILMDNNVLRSPRFNDIIDDIIAAGFGKGATYKNPRTGKIVQRDFFLPLYKKLMLAQQVPNSDKRLNASYFFLLVSFFIFFSLPFRRRQHATSSKNILSSRCANCCKNSMLCQIITERKHRLHIRTFQIYIWDSMETYQIDTAIQSS